MNLFLTVRVLYTWPQKRLTPWSHYRLSGSLSFRNSLSWILVPQFHDLYSDTDELWDTRFLEYSFFRFMTFFTPLKIDMTDNCLVSVCHFGDELYALTETNVMRRVDPETLDTVGEKASLSSSLRCSSLIVSWMQKSVRSDGYLSKFKYRGAAFLFLLSQCSRQL